MKCRKLFEKDLDALSINANIQYPIPTSSTDVKNTRFQASWGWLKRFGTPGFWFPEALNNKRQNMSNAGM